LPAHLQFQHSGAFDPPGVKYRHPVVVSQRDHALGVLGCAGYYGPGAVFSIEQPIQRDVWGVAGEIEIGSEASRHVGSAHRRFGQCHGETAFGAVMCRAEQVLLCGSHEETLQLELRIQVYRRRISPDEITDFSPIRRAAQNAAGISKNEDLIPGRVEVTAYPVFNPGQEPDHPDRRGRIDGASRTLIVERNIATGNWSAEDPARVRNAAGGFSKLIEDLRPFQGSRSSGSR
jgi:hypothetical protein